MNYQDILKELYAVNSTRAQKLGLENPLALDRLFGNPSKSFKAVHVAGTNGKGSVCIKIAKGLEVSGKKVGLYTSPHISSFRERIRINGKMIPEEAVERLMPKLLKTQVPATFFELTTLLAFLWFQEEKIDIAVLETGLGGRLDATNICNPLLTIITSISLDHTHILGKTLAQITKEKGGIQKPGVPMILGPRVRGLKGIVVEGNYTTSEEENCLIAKTAMEELELEQSAIQEGLKASMPCRFEKFSYNQSEVILDVAHNPDGLEKLFSRLNKVKPAIVFGISSDKDLESCIKLIQENASSFYIVQPNTSRAAPKEYLKELLLKAGAKPETVFIESNIQQSLNAATKNNPLVVACGTFFIMRELRSALGLNEPQDPLEMNEIKR